MYEIDQPQVMVPFKTRTLPNWGATPTADRRVVTADLRADTHRAARRILDPDRSPPRGVEGLFAHPCRSAGTACWTMLLRQVAQRGRKSEHTQLSRIMRNG